MEPRTTKHDKRLDLSYDLPHRARCSAVYPLRAPNGSTIIFYGYDKGLRVLWRGGRRIRSSKPSQPPGDSSVIILDDSEDGNGDQTEPDAEYDDDEEQLDESDSQEPSIVHDITIPLSSAVSRLAVPVASAQWPPPTQETPSKAVVTVTSIDGYVAVLHIPLAPTVTLTDYAVEGIVATATVLQEQGRFVRDLSMRFFGQAQTALYVAAVSEDLSLWRYDIDESAENEQLLTVKLDHTPLAVSFHPSTRSPLLLITDTSSAVRTFEPPLDWNTAIDVNEPTATGTWIATFYAPFTTTTDSSLPRRKRILSSQWVLQGRCIIVVLDDGAWGIWDPTALASPEKSLVDFAVSGYLDTATTLAAESETKRTGLFAPMTPNTRKAKSTALFAPSQPRSAATSARGGISVTRSHTSPGSYDESVLIWFGSDVYTIPSTQAFWQRSKSGGLGSLSAPGIARVESLNLFHERITSISQLPKVTGGVKITRTPDFLLSAESRLVIVQQTAPPSGGLFASKHVDTSELQDQRMLDAGELDLGGMDRILSTMTTSDARQRKVGFAH